MLIVRNILASLICVSPMCLFWHGLIVQGLVAGIVALAMAVTAASLRPGETEFLMSVARPALIAAAILALWVVVQILPLGIFAHPIWRSASTALHEPMLGSISVDPAATIISLGNYISLAAAAFLSAAVAVDRPRAEWIFFALSIATTVAGLIVIGHQFVPSWPTAFPLAQATACVSLGTIIAATNLIRAVEKYGIQQYQSRGSQPTSLKGLQTFIPGLTTLLICGLAFALLANQRVVFATAYGLLTVVSQSIIRRFGLGWWGIAGVTVPVVVIAVLLIGSHPVQREISSPLAFASGSLPSHVALSQRMLDDAPLGGIGAGTFEDLAPIYRQNDDPPSPPTAATAASALAIELGKPMLWLIMAATVGFTLSLLRASLRRGRDSFYAAMAASTLLTTLLSSFVDAGLFGTTTGLVLSAILGLGLAQSKSRTARA